MYRQFEGELLGQKGGGEWGCFRSPPNLRLSWPEPRSFESETLDLCVLNPGPLWSEPCTFAVGALDLCGLNPGPLWSDPWTFVVGSLDLCGRNPGPLWLEPWTFVVRSGQKGLDLDATPVLTG